MYQSIIYKEWIKTRRAILLISLIFVAFLIYSFIGVEQIFRINGAVQTWANILLKDVNLLPSMMEYLPVLVAIILGATQFLPEMVDKRLKLTLHLPLSEFGLQFMMLIYGLCILLAIYFITYLILLAGLSVYFPSEIILSIFNLSIPWFIAGFISYIFVAWICFEPVWSYRLANAILAIFTISLFLMDAKSGGFTPFWSSLLVLCLVSFSFPFYSTSRFKEGVQ